MVQTPLIYPGGKTLLLPHLRPLVPPHDLCLDLFGGGGAFILDASHKRGVYNDINSEACNFFRTLRDSENGERLRQLLQNTPYSREEYFDCDSSWSDIADPVERARRWFVVINLGFTHEEDCHSFRVAVGNNPAQAFRRHIDRLPEVISRLRDVVIENLDFRDALKIYGKGPKTLVFADPPYISPKGEEAVGYRRPFTIRDHYDLLARLNQTDSQVIVCGYDSELYHDMLREPRFKLVKKVRVAQVGNSDYSEREVRVEHIWVKKNQMGLFE